MQMQEYTNMTHQNIATWLESSFTQNATCPAIHVEGFFYSYEQVGHASIAIANAINNYQNNLKRRNIGILANRSIHAFTGIFGSLIAGHAYVPLNPGHPISRLEMIIRLASLDTIVLSEEGATVFEDLGKLFVNINVICPEPGEGIYKLVKKFKNHRFIFPDIGRSSTSNTNLIFAEDPAYIMFTSGSTGVPKGVLIKHKNACSYFRLMIDKFGFNSSDRHSSVHDISFDFSVHDIFLCILSGGCLFVLPKHALMSPTGYIRQHLLTVWSSVPSVAMMVSRLGGLSTRSLPSLRYTFFCGEALQLSTAQAWLNAACNSVLDNIYGPTEATVSITGYRYIAETPKTCFNGLVPIGLPYDGHHVRIVDGNSVEVIGEAIGELCLAGPQVASGYFENPSETIKRFVPFSDKPETIWYRTGDLVKRLKDGNLAFIGRLDEQIKVNGYRIELLEIEKAIRDLAGSQMAFCVPVISDSRLGVVDEIHAYIEGESENKLEEALLTDLSLMLPWYMVPSKIHYMSQLPINSNGKINKSVLQEICNSGCERYDKPRIDRDQISASVLKESECIKDNNLTLASNEDLEKRCCRCFKDLGEDMDLRGVGLIRIVNHEGRDDYICYVCLGGF